MLIRLGILLLRPFEIYHSWNVRRNIRNGRYRAYQGAPCITTARR